MKDFEALRTRMLAQYEKFARVGFSGWIPVEKFYHFVVLRDEDPHLRGAYRRGSGPSPIATEKLCVVNIANNDRQ